MTDLGTCANCAHWDRGAPSIATATRDLSVPPETGACCVMPPQLVREGPYWATAAYPQTHASRFCGEWEPAPESTQGGEAGKSNNVISFDRTTA